MQHLLQLFKRDIHALEYDPVAQYKFHRFWAAFWFLFMCAVPAFPILYGHTPVGLIIIEASNWANFATHLGAMSASLAAQASTALPTRDDLAKQIAKLPPVKVATTEGLLE
jgi:hypothetical protein